MHFWSLGVWVLSVLPGCFVLLYALLWKSISDAVLKLLVACLVVPRDPEMCESKTISCSLLVLYILSQILAYNTHSTHIWWMNDWIHQFKYMWRVGALRISTKRHKINGLNHTFTAYDLYIMVSIWILGIYMYLHPYTLDSYCTFHINDCFYKYFQYSFNV